MFVVDPRKSIAHLFAPNGHGQESQRGIIQTVIVLIRIFFYPIVEGQISAEESCPRVGRCVAGRYAARFFEGLLSPVETVNNVVLVTDMPCVLAGPTAQLNATQEKSDDEKNRKKTQAHFADPRRNYCTAQARLFDHSPKKTKKTKPDSTVSDSLCSKLCFL